MTPEERKREANWFDVGIIKGTSCTVSSYYLPNGDLEKSEIDVEVRQTAKTTGCIRAAFNVVNCLSGRRVSV